MNNLQLNNIRKIAEKMNLDGDYQVRVGQEIKAFHLPYKRAIEWSKWYKNSIVERM